MDFFLELTCPSGTTKWGRINDDIGGRGLAGHIYNISIQQCRDRCKNDSRCGGFHWFPPNVCVHLEFVEFFLFCVT